MKVTVPTLFVALFVALKLMGYIDWSWWWVFAPWWIPLCIVLAIVIVYLIALALETPTQKAARLLREYGDALSSRKKP